MMNIQELNCFYFPTSVILIDDNSSFLQQMQLALKIENIACNSYNDPLAFVEFMEKHYKSKLWLKNRTSSLEEDFNHRVIDIDIGNIHQEIYNADRFCEVSVIIVDYAMPTLDGLTLLEKLSAPNIRKILLTGEADEKIAVQAFNSGLINAYVRKDSLDFVKQVIAKTKEFQQQYFSELTCFIRQGIHIDSEKLPSLTDIEFIKYFVKQFMNGNYSEYYLLDEAGSFLFLDMQGKPTWLMVGTEKDFNYYLEVIAQYNQSDLTVQNLRKTLSEKSKLPFFSSPQQHELPPNEWQKYLHELEIVKGKTDYYCKLITNSSLYKLQSEILAYQKFLYKDTNTD